MELDQQGCGAQCELGEGSRAGLPLAVAGKGSCWLLWWDRVLRGVQVMVTVVSRPWAPCLAPSPGAARALSWGDPACPESVTWDEDH